eukprot:Pgem_evm1s15535
MNFLNFQNADYKNYNFVNNKINNCFFEDSDDDGDGGGGGGGNSDNIPPFVCTVTLPGGSPVSG